MARMQILMPAEAGTDLTPNRQEDGTALVWAADMQHDFLNSGLEHLRIVKGAGAAVMTVETHAPDRFGLALPDRTINIPANSDRIYRPLSPGAHNQRSGPDEGYSGIAFSDITGLQVYVIRPTERAV